MKIKDFYKDIGVPELKGNYWKMVSKINNSLFFVFISLLIIGIAQIVLKNIF